VLVVLPDLGDPAFVLDVGAIAARLEEGQNPGVVAGLAEDVQILGRPIPVSALTAEVPESRKGTPDSFSRRKDSS